MPIAGALPRFTTLLLIILCITTSPAPAAEKLLSPAAFDTSDRFGGGGWTFTVAGGPGVAVSGDVVVGGSMGDDFPGQGNRGSATVFRRSGATWVEEQTLISSTGDSNDLLGYSVAACGEVIVVGAPYDDVAGVTEQGSATVFRWSGLTWVEEQLLAATNGAAFDIFGASVSVSGDVVVVGAVQDDVGGNTDQGSATVFRWNGATWVEEQTLLLTGGAAFDYFGTSVSVSGNTIVVGANFHDVGGKNDVGSATVFRWNGLTWVEEQTLVPAGGAAFDGFGTAVSVSGDVLVASSPFDQVGGISGAGSATVFRWNGLSWVEEQTLSDPGGAAADQLGTSVAVNGHTILVGAAFDDIGTHVDRGSARLFRWDGASWNGQMLISFFGAAQDKFGAGVAVDGELLAVGAPSHDVGGKGDAGVVSVIDLPSTAWSDQGEALAGVFGAPRLVGTGDLSAGSTNVVDLSLAAPGAFAALFAAVSSTPIPFMGGLLLPNPFLPPVFLTTSASGTFPIPFVMPAGAPSGTEIWVQWGIVDSAAVQGVALSNAVRGVTP